MPVAVQIDLRRDVARLMSVPARSPAQTRLRLAAGEMIGAENLVQAAFSFRFIKLDSCRDGELHAGGEMIFGPRLVPEQGELTTLACGVATIGNTLEHRVTALFTERRPALALALDDLGNKLLFEVSRRLQDRMLVHARKSQLTMAGELRAGDPGLDISYQKAVVRLAGGEDIGVQATARFSLTPLKSTAMVMGAGIGLPPANWSRCDDCPSMAKCKLVRPQDVTVPADQTGAR